MIVLKKNDEFKYTYENGNKFYGTYIIAFLRKNELDNNRFGFVASKKTGNAVCRNRLKRLFREYCRKNENTMKEGYDIIIIAKKFAGENIKKLKYQELEKDFEKIFKISKLYKKNN